ncbi:hypothetical protein L0Y59_01340 [Candidatus Uhrbacteria bacterium]|nr:hypothetical protein [Candidatus Uhrbacteria bacterium]
MKCPKPHLVDPRDDDELVNQFPNLIVRPEDPAERRRFEDRFSVIKGESIRFRELLIHLLRHRARLRSGDREDDMASEAALKEAVRDALHAYYADTYRLSTEHAARDAVFFADALNAARETVAFLLEEYFPLRLRKGLELDSRVAGEHDPLALLLLCAEGGSDVLTRIRRFEAQRQLTLAQMEFELRVDHGDPQKLDDDLAWLARLCDRRFFLPDRSEQAVVVADLDPCNANRVKDFRLVSRSDEASRVVPTPERVVLPLDLRYIRVNGSAVPVYFEARVKRHVTLKLISKRRRHHESLTDVTGAKFVFFEEDTDLMAGIDQIRRILVRAPGSVSGEASNARRAGVLDPSNIHSSKQYRAWKFDVRLRNRIFELQFMYLPFFVNEMVAHGRDNHQLYKLGSYLDRVFPVLFPTELYGLDWRDEAFRQELWNFQIAKI